MTQLVQYKPFTATDIPILQHLGRATYEPYYAFLWYEGGLDWYMDRCFSTQTLRAELADPNIEYQLYSDDSGNLVGFMKLVLLKPVLYGSQENALMLEKIYLLPGSTGKGFGRQLVGKVIERARALSREAVWLTCMDAGPLEAYKKMGFRKDNAYRLDDFTLMREEYRGINVLVKSL